MSRFEASFLFSKHCVTKYYKNMEYFFYESVSHFSEGGYITMKSAFIAIPAAAVVKTIT